jgi:hypothetical protein
MQHVAQRISTSHRVHMLLPFNQARKLLLDVAKLHTALQDGPGVVHALELAVRASEAVHGTHANIVAKLCRRLGEAREVCMFVTRLSCCNFNALNLCLIVLLPKRVVAQYHCYMHSSVYLEEVACHS